MAKKLLKTLENTNPIKATIFNKKFIWRSYVTEKIISTKLNSIWIDIIEYKVLYILNFRTNLLPSMFIHMEIT